MTDRLVILDVEGILATGPASDAATRIAAALDLDADEVREGLLTRDFDGPDAVADWLGRPEAEDAIEAVWLDDQEVAEPLPGALDALERLAATPDTTLAVLANLWMPYLVGVLDHFGDAFDTLVTYRAYSPATGVAMPDPRAFTQLLDVAGIPAERATMVSADDGDRQAARALGLRTAASLEELA